MERLHWRIIHFMTGRSGAILAMCQSSSWCPQLCWPALPLSQAWWCSALHPFSYKAIPLAHRYVQDLELAGQAFPKVSGRVSAESPTSRKGHSLPSTYADFNLDRLFAFTLWREARVICFSQRQFWCPQRMVPSSNSSTGLCRWLTDPLAMVRTT